MQLPDGSTGTIAYTDAAGTVRVSGSQTYPTETRTDAFGQMVELKTWRDFVANTGMATTAWTYDPSTGLLEEKQYADLKKVRYQYDTAGRLAKRIWARGVETTYGYTTAGNLASVTYSDATPAVAYAYDRNGQILSAGACSYVYDPATLLLSSEAVQLPQLGVQEQRVLERKRDALRRDTGFNLKLGPTSELETTWNYDSAGRPQTLSAQGRAFTYEYVDGSPNLLSTVTGPVHMVINTW